MIRADNAKSELVRALKRNLEANGVKLVEAVVVSDEVLSSHQDVGYAIVRIVRENHFKRVLSVDKEGRAREYELRYVVVLALTAKGLEVPEQTLELSRDFLFDAEDVLSKSDEETDLLRDMQQDMVRLIMWRLQALAQHPQTDKLDAAPAPTAP